MFLNSAAIFQLDEISYSHFCARTLQVQYLFFRSTCLLAGWLAGLLVRSAPLLWDHGRRCAMRLWWDVSIVVTRALVIISDHQRMRGALRQLTPILAGEGREQSWANKSMILAVTSRKLFLQSSGTVDGPSTQECVDCAKWTKWSRLPPFFRTAKLLIKRIWKSLE
jgi:hypothetical protein